MPSIWNEQAFIVTRASHFFRHWCVKDMRILRRMKLMLCCDERLL